MLRPLFVTLFCVFAFTLSAQSFQDEITAADVPADVKQHADNVAGIGDVRWQLYAHKVYIFHKRDGNSATELVITEQDGLTRETTIHYDTALPAAKADVEAKVSGVFNSYNYLGYGETTTADGDELTTVYLEVPGGQQMLVIYFDANTQLVARRLHKTAL